MNKKEIFPNIESTVRRDICTGCGICECGCPSHAIKIVERKGRFLPEVQSTLCKNKTGCHLCYDICPGKGVDLIRQAAQLFNDSSIKEDYYIGRYIDCFTGYSGDDELRYHSASGGALTTFLIWLLENKHIDGAVVTKFDLKSHFKVKSFIATQKEDFCAAKSSKYSPVSLHGTAQAILESKGEKFVVVGLPCHIEGYRKLISKNSKLNEKIIGFFSLYCSNSRTFYQTEYMMKERKIDLSKANYLSYRDNGCLGGLVVKGEGIDYYEDYKSYNLPLRSFFVPLRCNLCVDHFGELSDISFGDIHVPPYSEDKIGINSIVVRTPFWKGLLMKSYEEKAISLSPLSYDDLMKSQKMAFVKKNRNASFYLLRKKIGLSVPQYYSNYKARVTLKIVVKYLCMRIQGFIGNHKNLWFIISFINKK